MLSKNKRKIIGFILIAAVIIMLLVFCILKLVNYSYLSGYFLGSAFLYISFIFIKKANSDLALELNPYNYLFFSTIRIGFYIIPFLMSIYIPIAFSIFGILIALIFNWIPMILIMN